ncbi:MAG: enoyl-CoA hydratase/isomerase family protein [Actinobacteria bacterium]|nr:enoyl-CoA hydratase/isomerase family protein [Actinomycetota bacterium]
MAVSPATPHQSPPATEAIRLTVRGPVAQITLARPGKLNALDRRTLEELTGAAAWIDEQLSIKVAVLAGEGANFSAGFDLADPAWRELGPPELAAATGRAAVSALGSSRTITIASVRGHCIGGGVVLAAACDLRIVSSSAMFRIPEVDLGVPLYWTGIPRLTRELGPALTKELVLTGRPFGAEEARTARFANRTVPDGELDSATLALALDLASKPALVLETTKQQVDQAAPPVALAHSSPEDDIAGFAAAFADEQCRAAFAAYLRRSMPDR